MAHLREAYFVMAALGVLVFFAALGLMMELADKGAVVATAYVGMFLIVGLCLVGVGLHGIWKR